ncbi:MAG TPA: PQQ-binding-like beta-propeller repeat protein, partial [Ktedonobacterales bacterium]|nr:PQQ-binding-like beta-propeller repeat protein [Ktedonobacterales bacterium]
SGLYFALDSNFIGAKSAHDLHYVLLALGARDGHVAWRHALLKQSPADSSGADYQPVYRDGVVYVSYFYDHADDPQHTVRYGTVEALDATTGKLRWRQEVGESIDFAGGLVVDGSSVYVSLSVAKAPGQRPEAASGLVVALDIQTGVVRWRRPIEGTPSMAASADGRVFVMAMHQSGGHLLALNAADGSVVWDYTSDAPLSRGGDVENSRSNAPLITGDRVYIQATERNPDGGATLKLLALNAGDGSVVWQHQSEGIAATPAFNQSGDTLCLSASDSLNDASAVFGLATSSGATRWSITGIQGSVSGCAASGNTFYLAQRSIDQRTGSVFALSGKDGRQLWKSTAGPAVAADGLIAPVVGNGMIAVYLASPASTNSHVMVTMAIFRVGDGRLLWRRDVSARPARAPDIKGNLIFAPYAPGGLPGVTAYARDTGATLWSLALGNL